MLLLAIGAFNHAAQIVGMGSMVEGFFHSNLFGVVQIEKSLLHSLHTVLRASLNGVVNLMALTFADEVAHGRSSNHNFYSRYAAFTRSVRNQLLREYAFEEAN